MRQGSHARVAVSPVGARVRQRTQPAYSSGATVDDRERQYASSVRKHRNLERLKGQRVSSGIVAEWKYESTRITAATDTSQKLLRANVRDNVQWHWRQRHLRVGHELGNQHDSDVRQYHFVQRTDLGLGHPELQELVRPLCSFVC